ncbi:Spp41p KNAG_0C06040 [Huiozyma naganishii CBS 8797]|uniref:DUF3020 domain-containing protein n=1 Tax=Huiozyma naganishii (strain ATCC MYA-139 / BCRC 22969 / CBS 8797 / KCTC 17520 / NBRC 10181 / NCYC 3082 / Yp74L-3) TaxID=1071383 RepID=J7S6D9_HUIN7|nr:hypothetical protein KNAG_0C06040 [Kazachstania naganishii CBS 8797]CCK69701.1 hypothetical protein KNAG_0C06040 [Kazachstania naganishii CBS 8797]
MFWLLMLGVGGAWFCSVVYARCLCVLGVMAEETDLNFSELIGNLLTSHNAGGPPRAEQEQTGAVGDAEGDVEVPDFDQDGPADDDLMAVVANAVHAIGQDAGEHGHVDADADAGADADADADADEGHWAHIIQQGLLDEEQHNDTAGQGQGQGHDTLDQDDENLGRAILASLQGFSEPSAAEVGASAPAAEESAFQQTKKAAAKKKKKKDKTAADKKKQKKKKHHHDKTTAESYSFPFGEGAAPDGEAGDTGSIDMDTQALVEATLKAFEKQILASDEQSNKSDTAERRATGKTQESTTDKALDYDIPTSIFYPQPKRPTATKKRQKKKKATRKSATVDSGANTIQQEDDFSKVLADMVNQVVHTSVEEDQRGRDLEDELSDEGDHIEPPTWNDNFVQLESANAEPFDLNQIMQNAMTLAFQDEHAEQADAEVSPSVQPHAPKPAKKRKERNKKPLYPGNEKFNKGLGKFTLADLSSGESPFPTNLSRTPSFTTRRQHSKFSTLKDRQLIIRDIDTAKPSSKHKTMSKKTSAKPELTNEEYFRKKFAPIANEAASVARKRRREQNKTTRLKMREEKDREREEKRSMKLQEIEKREEEQKELKAIVAKGPPYPADLRLTKKGIPKKPYRRWTPEEMALRAQLPKDEAGFPIKISKHASMDRTRPRKPAISVLKKLPLFNFVSKNITSRGSELNDIDGTLSNLPLPSAPLKELAHQCQQLGYSEREVITALKQNSARQFSPFVKTVLHKEKFLFHPPWIIPLHPPLALPVARRRPRQTQREDTPASTKTTVGSSFVAATKKLIPIILNPIIKTLKAAARKKIANGASPEEATRHLLTIVNYTKKSIIQTIINARQKATQERTSRIKREGKVPLQMIQLKTPELNTHRVPLFNLAKLQEIAEKEKIAESDGRPTLNKIKIEGTDPHRSIPKIAEQSDQPKDESDRAVSQEAPHSDAQEAIEISDAAEVEPVTGEQHVSFETVDKEASKENLSVVSDVEGSKSGVSSLEDKPPLSEENSHIDSETARSDSMEIDRDDSLQQSNGDTVRNDGGITTVREIIEVKDEQDETATPPLPKLQPIKPIDIKREAPREELAHSVKVESLVESLVKEQMRHDESNPEENVSLSSNLSNIITSTISGLIPNIQEAFLEREQEEEYNDAEDTKEEKIDKNKILNLDGLVPPAHSFLSNTERLKHARIPKRVVRKPRIKVHKSVSPPPPEYTFLIPGQTNAPKRKSFVLKRAKELLNADEMLLLRRAINKERKRKWREANVGKNWEHDLRSRLKKRASMLFENGTAEERDRWIEKTFNAKCEENRHSESDFMERSPEANKLKCKVTDNEALNFIASRVNRMDVARMIERDLCTEFGDFDETPATKRQKLDDSCSMDNGTSNEVIDISI